MPDIKAYAPALSSKLGMRNIGCELGANDPADDGAIVGA